MISFRMILTGLLLVGACLPFSLQAFYPVDGWWWNPEESGRGFNVEMQDDEMFVAAFHYTTSGQPVWWAANGRYNAATGRMTGEFYEYFGGQCAGCSYSAPDIVPGGGSPVTIDFHSAVHATLQWNGETIPIERQYWRFAYDQPQLFLFGEFHFTSGALGVHFGNRLYFDQPFTYQDGNEGVSGRVRGGSSSRIAVAGHFPDQGFSILVDSSTSFYQLYVFDMTKDRMEGNVWTFEKDDDPSGSGLPFIAHRVASRAYVQSGVGPHSDGALTLEHSAEHLDQRDRQWHWIETQAQQVPTESSTPAASKARPPVHALRIAMQSLRNQR